MGCGGPTDCGNGVGFGDTAGHGGPATRLVVTILLRAPATLWVAVIIRVPANLWVAGTCGKRGAKASGRRANNSGGQASKRSWSELSMWIAAYSWPLAIGSLMLPACYCPLASARHLLPANSCPLAAGRLLLPANCACYCSPTAPFWPPITGRLLLAAHQWPPEWPPSAVRLLQAACY